MQSSDLERDIRMQIKQRAGNQIQGLSVDIVGNEIVVAGHSACYYHKQLAIRGVFDAIGERPDLRIQVNIEVADSSAVQY